MMLQDKQRIFQGNETDSWYIKYGCYNHLTKTQTKLLRRVMLHDMGISKRAAIEPMDYEGRNPFSLQRAQGYVFSLEFAGLVKVINGILTPVWENIEGLYTGNHVMNPDALKRFAELPIMADIPTEAAPVATAQELQAGILNLLS